MMTHRAAENQSAVVIVALLGQQRYQFLWCAKIVLERICWRKTNNVRYLYVPRIVRTNEWILRLNIVCVASYFVSDMMTLDCLHLLRL